MRLLILAVLLAACARAPAPLPPAPLPEPLPVTAVVAGLTIQYRAALPGTLDTTARPHVLAYAYLAAPGCRVYLTSGMEHNAHVVSHEVGHCLAMPGGDFSEAAAERYRVRYLAACGESVRPLGLPDERDPTCSAAPGAE
jgi:hypothetical protein